MPVTEPVSTTKSIEARLDALEVLIKQNIQWSEVLYKDTKKIRRRLLVMQLWGWFKLVLIVAPVIAAMIYLPPYYRQAKDWYRINIEAPQKNLENNVNKFLNYLPGTTNQPGQNR